MHFNRSALFALVAYVSLSISGFAYPVEEIEKMAERDTALRIKWLDTASFVEQAAIAQEIRSQEQMNTKRLQEIVHEWGLPQEEDALDEEFFQLVLRSSDLTFQEEFLKKIQLLDESWGNLIPDLTDRILVRRGMAQRYGTHFTIRGESAMPYPIEDLSQVDQLRDRYGMDPIDKETKMMNLFKSAVLRNQYNEIHKLLFSAIHDLSLDSENTLYYASFDSDAKHPEEEGKFLAFETPALAIDYALEHVPETHCELQVDAEQGLIRFSFHNNPATTSYLLEKPIYIYAFPRGDFKPYDRWREKYLDQILIADHAEAPIEVIESDCVLEELIGTGVKLEFYDLNYQPLNFPDLIKLILVDFFFDTTIENESCEY